MTNARIVVLVAIVASFFSGCRDRTTGTGEPAREILADQAAASGPSTLIRLEERPSFPLDGQKRPFAMASDSDERAAVAGDEPIALEEPTGRF
jgi:hypothetical protein